MSKQTFSVTVNGKTYTRKTDRTYTHAVVLQDGKCIDQAMWCGSAKLAQKQLAAWQDMASKGVSVTLAAAEIVS